MGGEIRIVDKEIGQMGTCFRFNILLTISENVSAEIPDIESNVGDCLSTPNLGLKIQTSNRSLSKKGLSPRLNNFLHSSSPKVEGSRVVLLIKNEERRRIAQSYVENLGINVVVVDKWENLGYVLKRIKSKLGKCSSRSGFSSSSSKELPLSAMEGTDHKISMHKRRSSGAPRFVLLVIDANAGPFSEIHNAVERFRGELHAGSSCKVVWLNRTSHRGTALCEGDISFMKPFHGSRLLQVIKMLPEFGGPLPKEVPRYNSERPVENNLDLEKTHLRIPRHAELQELEKQEGENSRNSASQHHQQREIEEIDRRISNKFEEKILRGKKVLLVEDSNVLATMAQMKLKKKFGASTVDYCVNGLEAVRSVCERLREQRIQGAPSNNLPYDYIFMDCQMPEMDGYEATRLIRKEERSYGIHIPIIAVTAHESGSEEVRRAILAGMDVHLAKELEEKHLVEAIKYIQSLKLSAA